MAEQTEGSIEVSATAEEVMEVLTDFGAYPKWADGIRKAEVKKNDAKGRPSQVDFEVSQMGIGAKYTLAYRYRAKFGGLSWTTKAASGAVKDIKGEYALRPSGAGTTVTYRTTIEPAIPMMGFVKRQAERTIINTALVGLKKRVEGA
jgi:carbon monoxide dehydrogenase subunit G